MAGITAEVVRRAVARVEEGNEWPPIRLQTIGVSCHGGLDAAQVSGYLEELQEDRHTLARRLVIALDTN